MYSSRVKKAVDEFSELYGVAEQAYKRLQTLLGQIDDKIHNEFRYCSRGLKEFIYELHTSTEDDSIGRLLRATHAVKNAFNDSVDLILGYASSKIGELAHIDTGKELILYIPNLAKILEAIKNINDQIALSRADITNRIVAYKNIIESSDFKIVVEFCELLPVLENNIAADFSRSVKSARRFMITILLTSASILIGAIAVMQRMPEFFAYLSRFFPSLQKFL